MAVFTPVSLDELKPWMKQFPLGEVAEVRGISSGIENSNFFIQTQKGEFVLTIFERLSFEQLPFYLNLMLHLSRHGVLLPAPVANNDGKILHELRGKPAAIVTKLEGDWIRNPAPRHCAQVGSMLAEMHLAGRDFDIFQPNLRGLEWKRETAPIVMKYLSEENRALLAEEMRFQENFAQSETYKSLQTGPVHADLFRNNVMFHNEKLTGFFDFYFAGYDTWLFDVAVTVNDWCIDLDTGELDKARVRSLLDEYAKIRPFTPSEQKAWQPMLRSAALRFWLSRLYDFYLPREAQMLTPHDPSHFERVLRARIKSPIPDLTP